MTVTQGGHGQGEIEWQPDNVFFSFTFEVWLSLDSGATTGPYPIFCTDNKTVCLSVEGGKITGHYGDSSVEGGSLNGDQWYNVIFRHSVAGMHNIFNYLHSLFFFIWVLWPVKIISLILSQVSHKVGQKWEIPEKNYMTTLEQNLCDVS